MQHPKREKAADAYRDRRDVVFRDPVRYRGSGAEGGIEHKCLGEGWWRAVGDGEEGDAALSEFGVMQKLFDGRCGRVDVAELENIDQPADSVTDEMLDCEFGEVGVGIRFHGDFFEVVGAVYERK